MRAGILLGSLTALLIVGCATVSRREPDKDQRFKHGMSALASGDFATARTELAFVADHYATDVVGQRALLILATLELDPRNPERHPETGSDLAGRFLQLRERDKWVDPIAQTLYLLGMELGAEQRAESQQVTQPKLERALPTLPGPTVTARIKAVEQERDKLAKRVATLEEQIAQKDRELERIRKTIKP